MDSLLLSKMNLTCNTEADQIRLADNTLSHFFHPTIWPEKIETEQNLMNKQRSLKESNKTKIDL